MKKGFTLIELLVVIAIIAVLMGILMPALNRVKKQAQNITCRSRLKQWGMMFKLYTDDYEGKFNPRGAEDGKSFWYNALRPYYRDEWNMLKCPTCKTVAYSQNDWGTYKSWERESENPGLEGGSRTFVGSYSINSWTNNVSADRGARPKAWFWRTTHNLVGPANNIPVLADSTWMDAWPLDSDNPPQDPDVFGSGNQGTTDEMEHFCIDRHNGVINVVFMDWSVRGVGLKGLWKLKWHREFDINGPWSASATWPTWMAKYKDR